MLYRTFELGNRIEAVRMMERNGHIRRVEAEKTIKRLLQAYVDRRDKEVFPLQPFAKVQK